MPTSPATPEGHSGLREAPRHIGGVLRQIGPGLIMAGSIVGSGELIMTTKTGAVAGFTLLWLILVGCAIKTFAQVELGRYTMTWSRTTLVALDGVPGPRWRFNWLCWYWVLLTFLMLMQQGGIVGGIGQALAPVFPLTSYGREYDRWQEQKVAAQVELARLSSSRLRDRDKPSQDNSHAASLAEAEGLKRDAEAWLSAGPRPEPWDPYFWAVVVAAPTSICLYFGRYGLIQLVSTFLVMSFTAVTAITLCMLQLDPAWRVTGTEFWHGLQFQLPPATATGGPPLLTALATFGLIGVGSGELLQYPYWCLEKGYARFVGPRDESAAWLARATGWLRVLQVDAWLSTLVFTFSTAVFYLLGAAVLWRCQLVPNESDMVRTLTAMYVPVFGRFAPAVFLFGAFAVLYSTYFVAAASNALMISDGLGMLGLGNQNEEARRWRTQWISAIWPWVAVLLYFTIGSPVTMVRICGVGQTLMLPMLGGAALWFRYRRSDPRLRSGWWFDVGLWLSMIGFLISSAYTVSTNFAAWLHS